MSKTPILTKKQQKSSLSAKKTKTKETIRNVLASPYLKYWPLISTGHFQTLKNILNQCLPKLLPEKVKIPWTEIRKVPKTERKKFREQYVTDHLDQNDPNKNIEERNGLILGINSVTKALENHEAKSVLITEDILPRLMVEHIIDQAVLLGMPVLVVPELRNILKKKCGLSSSVIAFTNSPRYKLVQDSIQDVSKKYPIPEHHINFNRVHKFGDDSVILIEDSIIENSVMDTTGIFADKSDKDMENKISDQLKEKNAKGMDSVEDIGSAVISMKPVEHIRPSSTDPVQNVYLIRENKNKRVFIPEKSSGDTKSGKMEIDSSGFLSFSTNTPDQQKTEKQYKSLKVLRIRGDGNRTKRKIQVSKDRSKQKGNKKFKK